MATQTQDTNPGKENTIFEKLAAPDPVIALRLSGMITEEDIRQYRHLLEDKLDKYQAVSACIDLTGLSDTNAGALVEGVKADLEWLRHLNRFRRYAVVSDKEWPGALIGIVAPMLFPDLEIKVFKADRRDEAVKWAAEFPEAPKIGISAFRFLPTSREDVLAFEINGVISAEKMPGVIKEFETFLAHHDKVRMLNRMKHFSGIDPSAFMQHGLVSMKLAAMRKVERYAIVGAPGWICKIIETLNPAFPDLDMRTFPADQEDQAWAWLDARPRG